MDVKLGSPFLLVQECDHFFNLVSRLHVQGLGVHPGSVILLAVPKNALGESLLEESIGRGFSIDWAGAIELLDYFQMAIFSDAIAVVIQVNCFDELECLVDSVSRGVHTFSFGLEEVAEYLSEVIYERIEQSFVG